VALSPAAADLLRTLARLLLDAPPELIGELDREILGVSPEPLRAEPALVAEMAASTRANVAHWATSVLRDPEARVPANLAPEVLAIARDSVRRGADQMLLSAYHAGQNAAWRNLMALAFGLSDDPRALAEALDAAAASLFAFVDDMLAALQAQLESERELLTSGTHADRFEVVTLILEGARVSLDSASARLRYDLRRRHTGAILWSEDVRSADHVELAAAANALGQAPLTIAASSASLWAWFAGEVTPRATPGVRVAIGRPAEGIDGFRRTHLDAMAAQRLMYRSSVALASFEEVQLVALAAADEERAAEFVAETLGDLAGADAVLRETLRTYVRERFSAARAARALYAHRNTVLNRLERARRLLPAPLEHNALEVGLALEIDHWLA
jgi:DNA-binding PucR family transcriptional regulator